MSHFQFLLFAWIAIPILIFPILLKVRAPYGRHTKVGWGPMIDNHRGWFWMEAPALLTFPLLAAFGPEEKDILSWILIGLWFFHYFNRVCIFPFRLKTKGKKMPLVIALSAVFFNLVNGFVNGYYIGFIDGASGNVISIFAIAGATLFIIGFIINNMADSKLIRLRKAGNGYQIPRGWLFEYISCPNLFGEMVEWAGFALVARNPAALSFAIWTGCNLAPRAKNHHDWYKETFDNYPEKRKAVIPWVW